MRIMITGASGHLGRRLMSRGPFVGCYRSAAFPGGRQLDVRDAEAVRALFGEVKPEAVIHAASGRDDWRTIADGSAHVAVAAAEVGARLVHISTDAIFAGSAVELDESAAPDPIYRYGAAKAAAETAVLAVLPSAAVVRTSVILGGGDSLHELLVHDLVAGRVRGALFTDMVRKPVHVDDLADALVELAGNAYAGILNVAGADPINRYDLGVRVARRDGLDVSRLPAATIADRGLRLPGDVRLDVKRAATVLTTRLRGVNEFLPGDRR